MGGTSSVSSTLFSRQNSDVYKRQEEYGLNGVETTNLLYNGGLRIYTTVDPQLQEQMENAMMYGNFFPQSGLGVKTTAYVYDEDGSRVVDENGNPVTEEVIEYPQACLLYTSNLRRKMPTGRMIRDRVQTGLFLCDHAFAKRFSVRLLLQRGNREGNDRRIHAGKRQCPGKFCAQCLRTQCVLKIACASRGPVFVIAECCEHAEHCVNVTQHLGRRCVLLYLSLIHI